MQDRDSQRQLKAQYGQAIQDLRSYVPVGFRAPIQIGPGWYPLVLETHQALLGIDPGYQIEHIEEHAGGLQYRYRSSEKLSAGDWQKMEKIIASADRKARETCGECSLPGQTREYGRLVQALCADCYQAWRLRLIG